MMDDVSCWERREKLRNRRQGEEIQVEISLLPHQEFEGSRVKGKQTADSKMRV